MQTQNMELVIGLMLAKVGFFLNPFHKELTLNFVWQLATNLSIFLKNPARQSILTVKGGILGTKTLKVKLSSQSHMCINTKLDTTSLKAKS